MALFSVLEFYRVLFLVFVTRCGLPDLDFYPGDCWGSWMGGLLDAQHSTAQHSTSQHNTTQNNRTTPHIPHTTHHHAPLATPHAPLGCTKTVRLRAHTHTHTLKPTHARTTQPPTQLHTHTHTHTSMHCSTACRWSRSWGSAAASRKWV